MPATVNASLYWTIWIALALFAIGQTGQRPLRDGRRLPWTWWASACGVVLLAIHILIAFEVRHGWSHPAAVEDTARQTASVYGFNWGGGIYANYLFVAAWMFDLWSGLRESLVTQRVRKTVRVLQRVFYVIVILNAAVIFVPGPRRILGIALVLALLWIWRRPMTP